MLEFAAAATAHEAGEDEDVVEVGLAGRTLIARRPTTAQSVLFSSMQMDGDGGKRASGMFTMLDILFNPSDRAYIKNLILERKLDFDDLIGGSEQNPDGGIIDSILAEFGARPTQPSTDSSPSRAAGGRKSTGRAPGKGSTRSTSRSTDS
jgi:hypothetical protein